MQDVSNNSEQIKWSFQWKLYADSMKVMDPMKTVINIISQNKDLESCKQHLYTIIAELYNNALDHGVLGLDSKIKENPEGIEEFYNLKEERLENLNTGYIFLAVEYQQALNKYKLIMSAEDSGSGFDHRNYEKTLTANQKTFGRGIPLLFSLCEKVSFNESGNKITVEYDPK